MSSIAMVRPRLDQMLVELADWRQQLFEHPIYAAVNSLPRVQAFMEQHVFAVWDFMSLLKRLQQVVTCTVNPWLPPRDPAMARYINEIVLAEESDADGMGGHCSHFELYLQAMFECGANTRRIEQFIQRLQQGESPLFALRMCEVPMDTADFVRGNIALAAHGTAHEVAAVFCMGREDIIPEMFRRLIPGLKKQGQRADRLLYYVQRHIELDGESHGPLSRQLISSLAGENEQAWVEATIAAKHALQARIRLWDGVMQSLSTLP